MKYVKTFEDFLLEWVNYVDQYTPDEIATIEEYQGWSRSLNKQIATDSLDAGNQALMKRLDKIIAKSKNKTTQNQVVYRGVFNRKRYQEYLDMDGQTIVYKPFLSTSEDANIAKDFGKDTVEIQLKAGTPFIFLTDDSEFKELTDEKEVLLPRNLKFLVSVKDKNVIFKQI